MLLNQVVILLNLIAHITKVLGWLVSLVRIIWWFIVVALYVGSQIICVCLLQFVAKKLDKRLSDLGAAAIIERGLGDDQHPSG